MMSISEADWKVFAGLRDAARERLCRRALREYEGVLALDSASAWEKHERILELASGFQEQVTAVFGDYRRSTALLRLRQFCALGLVEAEEVARFSARTQRWIADQ